MAATLKGAENAPRMAYVLHGILGTSRNWSAFVDRWVRSNPSWKVLLVDHRGHGNSRGLPGPHDLLACAKDLEALAADHGPPQLILGHSFGTKVALTYVARNPRTVNSVWLVDAPPGRNDTQSKFEIDFVISAIEWVNLPSQSRGQVVAELRDFGLPEPIARWLSTSLGGPPGNVVFHLELDVVRELLEDYFAKDLWPVVEDESRTTKLSFVRASRSNRIEGENLATLRSLHAEGKVRLVELDSGHWVNADDPAGLWNAMQLDLAP
ncbi:MAG: alpha/beta hydrolase [Deltaproteobacteria bacterium]|nr:alpha/beta hydrolase [Deltaproteobacteria bacterium]